MFCSLTAQQLAVSRRPASTQPWTSPRSGRSLPSAGAPLCFRSETESALNLRLRSPLLGKRRPYRVEDGSQYDLVGAALQDDLNISLEETRLGEEFGLCCEGLRRLCAVGLPPEYWTLELKRSSWSNTLKLGPK